MKKIIIIAFALILVLILPACALDIEEKQSEQTTDIELTDQSTEVPEVSEDTYRAYCLEVLSYMGNGYYRDSLFPSDGQLETLNHGRVDGLASLYNELNEEDIPIARICGEDAIHSLISGESLTDEEAAKLDISCFYEIFLISDIDRIMEFFYGPLVNTADSDTYGLNISADLISDAGLVFFAGAFPSSGIEGYTSLSDFSMSDGKASVCVKGVRYDPQNQAVIDIINEFPAALSVKGAKMTYKGLTEDSGLPEDCLSSVMITLTGNGDSVWIESCDYVKANGYVTTALPNLRVRSGPSTGTSKLGNLDYGTKVNVYEKNGEWGRINFAGEAGWISLKYAKEIIAAEK